MNRIKAQHHRNNQTHGQQFAPRRQVDSGRLCAQDISGTPGYLIKKAFFFRNMGITVLQTFC